MSDQQTGSSVRVRAIELSIDALRRQLRKVTRAVATGKLRQLYSAQRDTRQAVTEIYGQITKLVTERRASAEENVRLGHDSGHNRDDDRVRIANRASQGEVT